MTEDLLVAANLNRYFGGVHATKSVNLKVSRGEVRAIIGPNGAGKSTLFNLFTGHLRAHSGQIHFKGRDVTRLPPHRRCQYGLGRTFQVPSCFLSATVLENVQVALMAHKRVLWHLLKPARDLFRSEAEVILALLGLDEVVSQPAATLSHGDQKKLEAAIALAGEPDLLLLDEPTSGMPLNEKPAQVELLRSIVRTKGLTAILIEHDMDVVFSVADRITVIHQGAVIADGLPEEVRASARVQEVYLGDTQAGGASATGTIGPIEAL